MSFANPLYFWAFISLIPLIGIYFLKVRPNRKPTTAFFLWQDIFQEKRTSSLFHRLRDLISLLLMLLVFSAIALALTKPIWIGDDRKDLVLIIDVSASMNASDGNRSRLDAAKRAAAEIVEALNGTQRCSVATVANKLQFVSNMTDNPRQLLSAIESIDGTVLPLRAETLAPLAERSRLSEPSPKTGTTGDQVDNDEQGAAVQLPESLQNGNEPRVIFISDGIAGNKIPNTIELMKVGQDRLDNAGLVACDMQRLPGENRVGVFYQLFSTFAETVEAELVLGFDEPDNVVKLIPLQLKPGLNEAAVFELDDAQPGKWRLTLEIDDALTVDNQVDLILPAVKPIEVSVNGNDRFFYENSVVAFSQSGGLLSLVPTGGQLWIGQNSIALPEDRGADAINLLIFQPDGESPWWQEIGAEIDVVLPRALDRNHPAIRHIDVASIPFVGAKRTTLPPGADVWVEAEDQTPLIYKMTRSGVSAVVVNLDPLASNFYFSAWFPVLVYSTATHLAGRSEAVHSTYPTGQIAPIVGATGSNQADVIFPDGNVLTTAKTKTPILDQAGVYQIKNDSGNSQLASSLLSVAESNIDNSEFEGNSDVISRGTSPVGLLTILAIAVAVVESILYQRRKVG